MASVEDIKNLLSQQTEALNLKRDQERSEDFLKISDLIQTTVKTQIRDAIDPISKRQDELETKTSDQYNAMVSEFSNLKQSIDKSQPPQNQNLPSHPAPAANPLLNTVHQPPTHPRSPGPTTTPYLPLWDITQTAERTVGFQPLVKGDIDDICRVHKTNDIQYAMKLLILEYLKFEMKNDVTKLSNIVKVFPPAKPIWNTLYVEFDTRASTQTVYWYTRFLRDKEHKVTMYVPHQYWAQFDHLGNIAHKYRQPPNVHKTRTKFGQRDMYLQVRAPNSYNWLTVDVPDLPPLTLQQHQPDMSISPSLAPGRSRTSAAPKRGPSSPAESRDPKALKPSSPHSDPKADLNLTEDDVDEEVVNVEHTEHSIVATKPASETQNFL